MNNKDSGMYSGVWDGWEKNNRLSAKRQTACSNIVRF